VAKTLLDFEGCWLLERSISDNLSKTSSHFSGRAELTRDALGLKYTERGVLMVGDIRVPAERKYFWRWTEGAISVFFEDGRPFHTFDPRGYCTAEHWCDPDHYKVFYDLDDWPMWRTVWTVVGPRKNYVMSSGYFCQGSAER
jgi:hypothetical protein